MKWCEGFNKDNFKHFTRPVTFGKRHHSPPYNILCASLQGLHPNVILNGSPKTLDVHIFLKSSLFWKCKAISYSFENIFPMVYSMLQLDFIWPLLSKDLWLGIKFPIWFPPLFSYHNSCKLNLNEQCKGNLSIYTSRPF
jgi:hypothetical protein